MILHLLMVGAPLVILCILDAVAQGTDRLLILPLIGLAGVAVVIVLRGHHGQIVTISLDPNGVVVTFRLRQDQRASWDEVTLPHPSQGSGGKLVSWTMGLRQRGQGEVVVTLPNGVAMSILTYVREHQAVMRNTRHS